MASTATHAVQVEISDRLGRELLARRVHLQDLRHPGWTPEEAAAILLARAYASTASPSEAGTSAHNLR